MEEAKIIENDLALIEIDTGEVTSLILGMDAEIRNCSDIVAELKGSIDQLPEMQTEDVKRIATDINGHLKHADEARKRFKREWKKPQDKVEAAFKQAIEPMTELVNAYKGEAAKRDQQIRQERYELLCEFYEADAPTLAALKAQCGAVVPLEGAVSVKVDIYRRMPKNRPKKLLREFDTYKPDADNIAKAVLDAMNGLAFVDDSQVVSLTATKHDRTHRDSDMVAVEIEEVAR